MLESILREKLENMTQEADIPTFKCALIGDGGTGKSTFVKRHMTGEFEKKIRRHVGCRAAFIDFPFQEKFRGLRDGYYIQGQIHVHLRFLRELYLFATNSVKILTTTLEPASRRNIGGAFGAELDVPFNFSVEFSLSNNAIGLFFKASVS